MKKLILLSLLCIYACCNYAQTSAKETILQNKRLAASNALAYIEPTDVRYTQPPKGYEPVYLSMYARHGSRHLMVSSEYTEPLEILRAAYMKGCLKSLGKRTMVCIDSLERIAHGREGELTTVGAQQHQGIAKRIYEHFPQLFSKDLLVDARSTPLQRTMMSMFNQCQMFKTCAPTVQINADASNHDVWWMDYQDALAFKYRSTPEAVKAIKDYTKKTLKTKNFINRIFMDQAFIEKNVKPEEFMQQMLKLANMVQNEGINMDIYDIFSDEELFSLWKVNNFKWYVDYTYNPLTLYKAPYTQIHLLCNFIHVADSCLASPHNHITMRFGHEVDLLPLACLMKLSSTVYEGSDGDEVAENWRNYNIYPMAGNVQFVFFRKKGQPDLVKIMLNEHEQTLPIKSNIAPYYTWKDVKDYLNDILSQAPKE